MTEKILIFAIYKRLIYQIAKEPLKIGNEISDKKMVKGYTRDS